MKPISLSILLLLAASLAVAQTISLDGSGDQASVFLGNITLEVTKGSDANGNPSTLLRFHIESRNPDGTTTSVIGFGPIPNEAFVTHGPSKMSLNVDTSQVAGFSNTICIFTPSPHFGFTCSPSQGGPVQIDWRGNGLNSESETVHLETTTGPVTEKSDGHGDLGSADTEGSVLGVTFSSRGEAFGSFISSGHGHTITITKNN